MFPPFATETLGSGYKKESVVLADTGDQTASQLCFLPSLCKTRNDSFTTQAAADARMSGTTLKLDISANLLDCNRHSGEGGGRSEGQRESPDRLV